MALNKGDRLGPYEIIAPLDKGGMGEVYRSLDTRVQREVAIKTSSERFSERFEREARVIASLNHPNICTLFDVGPDYLVMELVEGPTLADRTASGAIPFDESMKLAAQIADALSAAHRKGVIHRDLKPANIKVKADGTVKVLDFGLAKVVEAGAGGAEELALSASPTLTSPAMTMAGVVLGTAAYMSPEQAKGKAVDKTADIWAFGVVVYEMLTGRRLYHGESASETLASVLKDAPDLSRVPPRARRLLRSCLQKNPEQRLHEISDWKLLLDDEDIEPPKPLERARWLWPSIAVLLLAAAVAAGFVMFRGKAPAAQEVRTQIPKPEGLTFNPGTQATISPDARWLAFVAAGSDNISRIYIRSLDSLEVKPLPGSEGVVPLSPPPFWSYDSQFVVYGAQGKLKKSEITGTPAQVIAETGVEIVQGVSWSRDDVILYARPTSTLERVSSTGGAPVPVTVLAAGDIAHRWPQFLPDGRRFLYLRVSGSPDKTGVYVGSLDVKPDAQSTQPLLLTDRQVIWVTSESSGRSYLLIQRDELLMAQRFNPDTATLSGTAVPIATGVGSFSQATAGLWSAARNGALMYRAGGTGPPVPVSLDSSGAVLSTFSESGAVSNLNLSPDGRRLAYTLSDPRGSQDIWVRDLSSGATTKLTFDPQVETAPVWSPDNTRIAFAAVRRGRRDLYEKNADGSGEERLLLESDQDKTPSSWSQDGRFLLFHSLDPQTREDLWILPLEGRQPFVFLKTNEQELAGQFAPDGRWIAYTLLTSGTPKAFVRPFTPDSRSASGAGAQWLVSNVGGVQPRWSADGKRLYWLSLSRGELLAVDVGASTTFQVGPVRQMFSSFGLGGVQGGTWSVNAAGDRFFFVRVPVPSGPPPPFTLVLNWMTKLEQ